MCVGVYGLIFHGLCVRLWKSCGCGRGICRISPNKAEDQRVVAGFGGAVPAGGQLLQRGVVVR